MARLRASKLRLMTVTSCVTPSCVKGKSLYLSAFQLLCLTRGIKKKKNSPFLDQHED